MDVIEVIAGNIVNILCTVMVTGAVGCFANLIRKEQKEREKERSDRIAERKGTLALLHNELYQACKDCIFTDQIELEELKNIKEMYKPYAELGGNGICKRLYERCLELPIVEHRGKGGKNEN